ncbi:MAG: glycoside hydrolase family 125 protein, partial [Carnobacterium sp.]
MVYQEIPKSIEKLMNAVTEKSVENPRWAENFNASFSNTLLTTVKKQADGTTFLLTGDIPAMWLRDSTAQVRPYLLVAKEDE